MTRNFRDIGPAAFVLRSHLIHIVRSHLEYNNSVWAPYRKSDIDKLEKVHKRATKMVQEMGNFKYPERLRQLELPTLTYRRNRGDMIVCYLDYTMSRLHFTWIWLPIYHRTTSYER